MSLPTLGAWIEIKYILGGDESKLRRSLHWERGLKFILCINYTMIVCRSLHWERGLKSNAQQYDTSGSMSLPTLGAWIEIVASPKSTIASACRSLHWERGLKFHGLPIISVSTWSLPTLGAWIEILKTQH